MSSYGGPSGQQEKPIFLIESPSDANIAEIKASAETEGKIEEKQSTREWVLALIMLLTSVALTTVSSQLSNLAFTDPALNFKAPYLFVLFKIAFRSLAFPIYIVVNTTVKLIRRRKIDFPRTWRRCILVCGDEGLTIRVIFFKFFPPMFFNLLLQIAYTLGIQNLSASLASALTPPAVATSYIMAWIFFRNRVLLVKVIFVFVSFGGVAFIVYDKLKIDFLTPQIVGISAMMVQDLSLSSYQMLFKRGFPKGDLGQVSFAVSGMYLLMLLLYFPIPIILKQTGVETYDISELPYPYLIVSWSSTAVGSMVYGYGLVIAGGFFMGLSDLLILAANSGIDGIRGIVIPTAQIIGTFIIGGAFIVLVLPDRYVSVEIRKRMSSCFFGLSRSSSGESRTVLELQEREQRSSTDDMSQYSRSGDLSAVGEEDVLENKDLRINSSETQLKV